MKSKTDKQPAQVIRLTDRRKAGGWQPININTDHLTEMGVAEGDVLWADIGVKPRQGEFSYIKLAEGFILGFYFDRGREIKVVRSCQCCVTRFLSPKEIIRCGPFRRRYPQGLAPFERFFAVGFDSRLEAVRAQASDPATEPARVYTFTPRHQPTVTGKEKRKVRR
jgi:hypothetical protein